MKLLRQLVTATLEANGLRWREVDGEYGLRFSSALIRIGFLQFGGQRVVTLRSPVLSEVDAASASEAGVLSAVNDCNCRSHFAKWAWYPEGRFGTVMLEYDLLGDHMQPDELMTALTALARLADQEDDRLQRALGTGHKAFES